MIALRSFPDVVRVFESVKTTQKPSTVVVCGLKGPRPRYPRVWKTQKRIGTISKSQKLLKCMQELSNVKEEVYGALDSFIAWELEFPLIMVKKAIRSLEEQKDWKRIIQVTKWMLSKGQGRTMGTYTVLLNALAEDGRLEEAEQLWTKLFSENLESTPRNLFNKMIAIYYHRGMYDKMFEIFADMEELEVQPNVAIVSMMGTVFRKLGMLDKYAKLKRKYPPARWVYRYIKGRRIKVRARDVGNRGLNKDDKSANVDTEQFENDESSSDRDDVELQEVEPDSNDSFEIDEVIETNETKG